MAPRKRGKWRYGDSQADIRTEIARHGKEVGYQADHYEDAVCECGGRVLRLYLDDDVGVVSRVCVACGCEPHFIGDSGVFRGRG